MTTIVPNTRRKDNSQKFRRLRLGDWFYCSTTKSYCKWCSNKKSETKHHIFKCVGSKLQWTPTKGETYYALDFVERTLSAKVYQNNDEDIYNIAIDNCFKTANEITDDDIYNIFDNMQEDFLALVGE